jgi:hypothetical protein
LVDLVHIRRDDERDVYRIVKESDRTDKNGGFCVAVIGQVERLALCDYCTISD